MSHLKKPKEKYKGLVSHRRSVKQEKELAKRIGGRTIHRSGAGMQKGDVRVKNVVRIEAKTTKKKSFSVTRDMVQKIEDAALPYGETPAIVIEFIDEDGNPEMEVAVLPTWVLDD